MTGDAPLPRIGARVRAARARVNMPRRVLAEQSGVSMRYLAQLEGGSGNISVALLDRVAAALGVSLEELVMREDPWESDVAALRRLIDAASPETRALALDWFEGRVAHAPPVDRVCLIGLRGAGKSSLGKAAAAHFGVPFVEMTTEIEARTGMPMAEVLAFYGEDGYRRIEAETLREVTERDAAMILAVAGGIVSEAETFDALLAAFHTIWVQARPEEHMARVRAQGDLRPMAGNPAAMDQLRAILTARAPQYARAGTRLDTSGASFEESLQALITLITDRAMLPVARAADR